MQSFLIFNLIFIGLAYSFPNGNTKQTIVVDVEGQGSVRGDYDTTAWTKQTFMQFRGIPYAESPSGPLRYKAPKQRSPWRNVLDATNWGRRCPVYTTTDHLSQQELQEDLEDCLNLCVYTKNLNGKRPVMVYIHGGGFYNGTSSDHPPKYLLEKDIVLVVPQYRIGIFGYISTGTDEIPGNAAIADVIFSLEWVKKNIAKFGGDAEQITIFGQSAGSVLINTLLISPKTPENLFHRVIMQSGSVLASWGAVRSPLEQAKRVCNALKCKDCNSNVDGYSSINSCLMNADVISILNVTKSETISPVIGDNLGILPQSPNVLLQQMKKPLSIPIMTGFTKHDCSYALAVYYDQLVQAYGPQVFSLLTVRQFLSGALNIMNDPTELIGNLALKMFFNRHILDSRNNSAAIPAYFDVFNVAIMKSPILAVASYLVKLIPGKTYVYTFDYEGEYTRFGYEMGNEHYPFNGGVHHSNDYLYLFSTHFLNKKDTMMAMKMVDYWTSFAVNGVPFSQIDDENFAIPHMETESGPYIHINEKTTIGYDVFDEFTVTLNDPENWKLIRNKTKVL